MAQRATLQDALLREGRTCCTLIIVGSLAVKAFAGEPRSRLPLRTFERSSNRAFSIMRRFCVAQSLGNSTKCMTL